MRPRCSLRFSGGFGSVSSLRWTIEPKLPWHAPRISVSLPWPPSTNRIWRSLRSGPLSGRVLLSAEGREYLSAASAIAARANRRVQGRVGVVVKLHPPNRRRFDIDNRAKILLDAMTKGGCWDDDSQIDVLIIERGEVCEHGRADVMVWEA